MPRSQTAGAVFLSSLNRKRGEITKKTKREEEEEKEGDRERQRVNCCGAAVRRRG